MVSSKSPAIVGRPRQARVNDARILEAACTVFLGDPEAPMSAVAEKAAVGMSALYLRYKSKGDLLREICRDGLVRYISEVEVALADDGDIWSAFSQFAGRIVDANTHAIVIRLAGTFTPDKKLYREATKSQALTGKLFERLKAANVIRPDVVTADIAFIFEQLANVRVADKRRSSRLRRRYLALYLDALAAKSSKALPGPEPRWQDVNARWDAQSTPKHSARTH